MENTSKITKYFHYCSSIIIENPFTRKKSALIQLVIPTVQYGEHGTWKSSPTLPYSMHPHNKEMSKSVSEYRK